MENNTVNTHREKERQRERKTDMSMRSKRERGESLWEEGKAEHCITYQLEYYLDKDLWSY